MTSWLLKSKWRYKVQDGQKGEINENKQNYIFFLQRLNAFCFDNAPLNGKTRQKLICMVGNFCQAVWKIRHGRKANFWYADIGRASIPAISDRDVRLKWQQAALWCRLFDGWVQSRRPSADEVQRDGELDRPRAALPNVALPYGGLTFIAVAFGLNLIHQCLGFFRRPLSDAGAFLPHDFLQTAYFPVFSRFCADIAAVRLHQPGLAVVV